MIAAMLDWVGTNLDPLVPILLIGFLPARKWRHAPPAGIQSLTAVRDQCHAAGFPYPFVHDYLDLPASDWSIQCHACAKTVFRARPAPAVVAWTADTRCAHCGQDLTRWFGLSRRTPSLSPQPLQEQPRGAR